MATAGIQETRRDQGSYGAPYGSLSSSNQGAAIQNALRLVLIGTTGTGKSSVGNSIVAWGLYFIGAVWDTITAPFVAKTSPNSVTITCTKETHIILGRQVDIVDTPGFLDTREGPPYTGTIKEVTKCLYHIQPGPHAILFVVKLGRFTPEVVKAMDIVKEIFSEECLKYLIIVFTHIDTLGRGETLDGFVHEIRGSPLQLLRDCNMRYVGFNNQFDPFSVHNKLQVENLLTKIEELVKDNKGKCYTEGFLNRAARVMDQEQDAARAAESRDGRKITADMTAKVERVQQEHEEQGRGWCFASDSVVRVRDLKGNVGVKSLKELVAGDLVQSYDSETNSLTYSPVYYIVYQDDNERLSDLRELFYDGIDGEEHSIRLQGKHLIYASCGPLPALKTEEPPSTPIVSEKVQVGDTLWVVDDDTGELYPRRVLKINEIVANVRHPMTINHTIVVDGVLASVHTHNEWLLRQATAPLRLLYKISPRLSTFSISKKAVQAWDCVEYYILNKLY